MSARQKPSLSGLMAEQKGRRSKTKKAEPATAVVPADAPPPPPPLATAEDTRTMARKLMVRRFCSAFLKNGMDGAKAYREVAPHVKQNSSWALASEMLKEPDVKDELGRQLRGIFNSADMDEEWVYRQYRSIAHSNIFDYVEIDADGKVKWKLDPNQLTLEQQLNIRSLKVDAKTGKITDIRLVDRQGAVDSVAKARKMFSLLEDTGLKDLVKDITERMQAASKHVRTFDNETGEQIE